MDKSMLILFDHLCFNEKYGGVSKYFSNMINNLPPEINVKISVKFTDNEYIDILNQKKIWRLFAGIDFRGKARLIDILNKTYSIAELKNNNFDIYHQTHYDPYGYKYIPKNKKRVVTIHDMNYFKIPQLYKNNYLKKMCEWQQMSCQYADEIITVSQNTKKDIIDILKIPENKITTIYLGNNKVNINNNYSKKLFEKPYILFVGARSVYKNFTNYLKVFKIISEKYNDLLFICSGRAFSRNERKLITDMNLNNKIIQISADEKMMVNLYLYAELFVYPSFYEGFGLPLLEAMNCRCPILCSNTSCFPEIAQNAALYFDPYSIENMVESTKELLFNKELRNVLIRNGIQRKEAFSWKKCAIDHANLYKSLV
jgi:glycosyltransferase involved in cell wall biosynthesis